MQKNHFVTINMTCLFLSLNFVLDTNKYVIILYEEYSARKILKMKNITNYVTSKFYEKTFF
jgi:hypothetical protein